MATLNTDLSQYWNQDPDRDRRIYESTKSHDGVDCNCCPKVKAETGLRLRFRLRGSNIRAKAKAKARKRQRSKKNRLSRLSIVEKDFLDGVIGK